MIRADVAVVGGGPAGVASAITLARGGRQVVLVDKARFPRDKCCGDGLTTAALRRYEAFGLRPEVVPSWRVVEDVCLRSPWGHTVTLPLPRRQGVFAAVARRTELDAAFLDAARAAGVAVHDGHAVVAARLAGDAVTLEADGLGEIRAPYAIGADGIWSPLRKLVGAGEPGYLGEFHAFRQYFQDVAPTADRLWVWFEPDVLPGYVWSFPLPDGGANVGFGVARLPGRRTQWMREVWPALLARPHIRDVLGETATPEAPHKAWPIPARLPSTPLVAAGGRALFVGDAARAGDPLTGEGIAQALESGTLAAEAILAAGPAHPERATATYQREVGRGLARDLRFAELLARPLAHRRGVGWAMRLVDVSPWTRRHFARWLFEDYPRAVLATPGRWRAGMLSGVGAYRS